MGYNRFGPGCCCCPTIGYDESAWGWPESCCTGTTVIQNLKTSLSQLSMCRVVFGGNNGVCGEAVRFGSGDWAAVKSWIESGGRLFMCAEHSTICFSSTAQTNLANFLSAVGSSMSYAGGDLNGDSPACFAAYYTPGDANIAQGITFTGERFGQIDPGSGKSVWLGSAGATVSGLGVCAVAAEQLGNGFLFLSGDGNHGHCSGYCDFVKRLWEYADADIL